MVFKTLFAIAAFYDLNIDQMNIETAFLYDIINELFYIEMLKSYENE